MYNIYLFYDKYGNNKTSVRSIRLSITPTVKLLQYCNYFNIEKPDMNILSGYLWVYHGQRSAITGFINFLSGRFKFDMSVKVILKVLYEHPKISKKHLKQRLINLLRKPTRGRQLLLKTAIEYLHSIEIPENVFLDLNRLKVSSNYIYLRKEKFYIPSYILN